MVDIFIYCAECGEDARVTRIELELRDFSLGVQLILSCKHEIYRRLETE